MPKLPEHKYINWKMSLCMAMKHNKDTYSQFASRVTGISENEINFQNFLCDVRHVNGMLNISLEIFPKKTH